MHRQGRFTRVVVVSEQRLNNTRPHHRSINHILRLPKKRCKFSKKFLFMQINAIIFHKILHMCKKNRTFAAIFKKITKKHGKSEG
jgi:hypothetical protein